MNQQPNHIPQQFVWPDHEKPSTNVQPLQVPLIDLAGFLSGDSFLVSEATRLVSEAAQQHGFFLVTNHGVDETLLSRAYKFTGSFFKAQRTWGESAGYGSSFVGRYSSSLPWKATLSFEFTPEEKCHSQTFKDFVTRKMGDVYEDFG
ncbi:unnamed protein product [Arabis nemorensis]|uniref:Non-haem dioxygenase N-terminal domain-containing protein n=1 Tax=Arabis nemorensis TaxID=586526 RepID=A0A565CIY9_9BRAS|nr:unnamed protein product [Arabis nemorensis]